MKKIRLPSFDRFKDFSPGQLLHNKLFIGAACIVLAIAIGFGAVPLFNASTRKTVKIYQAKDTIYEYQQITKEMVEQVEVGSYGLSGQAVTDLNSILGKTARTKIVKGDNILTGQLMTGSTDSEFLSDLSSQRKRAVSVTLPTLSASVSGQIISGDVVSVLTYQKQAQAGSKTSSQTSSFNNGITGNTGSASDQSPVLYPDLQYVQIATIHDKSGNPVTDLAKKTSGAESSNLPSTVTFICTEQQALELAQIDKKGDMYLVFVARGAQAEKLIKQQDNSNTSSAAPASSKS